ncbi:MAG TPA: hypothetical protein VHE99_03195 [Gammaproteobacteria bacterium]|nr:hypothetical protein [Gammaproteobacteria bacterium]
MITPAWQVTAEILNSLNAVNNLFLQLRQQESQRLISLEKNYESRFNSAIKNFDLEVEKLSNNVTGKSTDSNLFATKLSQLSTNHRKDTAKSEKSIRKLDYYLQKLQEIMHLIISQQASDKRQAQKDLKSIISQFHTDFPNSKPSRLSFFSRPTLPQIILSQLKAMEKQIDKLNESVVLPSAPAPK